MVVSKIVTLFSLLLYYITIIYLLLYSYYLLPYYFSVQIHLCSIFLYSFFSDFSSKIEKNSQIFCNFFSLCIN